MQHPTLITGAAGFIGSSLTKRFLTEGKTIVGIDNLNDYYDPTLKKDRLKQFIDDPNFTFIEADIANKEQTHQIFQQHDFHTVVNLAAQAGVRHSIENPEAYVEANLVGFAHVLEGARRASVKHLVYASSSSVYGLNTHQPFSEQDNVDHPISFYAATKKANEIMAHSYSYLYNLPVTGLRFFTVYGPWGRPDMALFYFTKNIIEGKPIDVYNEGNMIRDFTFIDDLVEGLVRVVNNPAEPNTNFNPEQPDPSTSSCPYRLYNIGSHHPVPLMDFIAAIENATGKKANTNFLPLQPGDVPATYADVERLVHDLDYQPNTPIQEGINKFVAWYTEYFR